MSCWLLQTSLKVAFTLFPLLLTFLANPENGPNPLAVVSVIVKRIFEVFISGYFPEASY